MPLWISYLFPRLWRLHLVRSPHAWYHVRWSIFPQQPQLRTLQQSIIMRLVSRWSHSEHSTPPVVDAESRAHMASQSLPWASSVECSWSPTSEQIAPSHILCHITPQPTYSSHLLGHRRFCLTYGMFVRLERANLALPHPNGQHERRSWQTPNATKPKGIGTNMENPERDYDYDRRNQP